MVKNISFKDKKDLTKQEIYDILNKYILDNLELSSRKIRDEENFVLSAWSEFQAFHVGQQKAFHKVLDFIQALDQRKNIVN